MTKVAKPVATIGAKKPTTAEIQKQIAEAQKMLQEQIEGLRAKNKLIDDLNTFKRVKAQIETVQQEQHEPGDLSLKFSAGRYSSNEVLKVSNLTVIHGFMEFIVLRIEEKIKSIELEIVK